MSLQDMPLDRPSGAAPQRRGSLLLRLLPFVACGALLTAYAAHRLPWIDESWFAGPAVSLIRTGRLVDLGALTWNAAPQQAFSFEAYAFLQAPFYLLGGVHVLWGRALSVVCALAFLVLMSRALRLLGVGTFARACAVVACGTNRYFLTAATQIRPEAAALATVAGSLLCLIRWSARPERVLPLVAAHGLCIFAALLHLQAAFVGAALWWVTFHPSRGWPSRRIWVAALGPYAIAAAGVGAYLAPRWQEFVARSSHWFGGDMLGHGGGMIGALSNYVAKGETHKVAAVLGLVAAALAALAMLAREGPSPARRPVLAYGAGAFASWLLTTANIDALHASWLMLLFLPGVGVAVHRWTDGPSTVRRLAAGGLLVVALGLSGYGVVEATRAVAQGDRQRVDAEVRSHIASFGSSTATFVGPREILWYFDFDVARYAKRSRAVPPEYYFTYHWADGASNAFEGAAYRRVRVGECFDLFRRE